ncbi:hypothetical protein BDZ89DRAFT_1139516 [Hymenopellis radicata]|nr:hypothetical protein BDZ89DRAFT_1139516 [Hymenopellis radicata]
MSSVAQHFGLSDAEVIQRITVNLNQHIIEIFTYGLYTMVFVSTIHQIGARSSADKWPSQRIALTIIICVIWALTTVYVGISWNGLVSTYVTYGQSQNSVLGYVMDDRDEWSKKRLVLNVFANTAIAFNAILAELINIWRCWELYNRNYLIAGFPLLCVLCGLLSHILNMVFSYIVDPSTPTSLNQINWQIVYYSVTAFTNVLTTFLIIFRILSFGGLRIARTYHGLLEILVESAFLYSATYIVYLVLDVRDFYLPYWSFTSDYAYGLLNAVTALAPTMIIQRVMSGGARPNDSWTHSSLPSMGSTICGLEESIQFGSVHPAQNITSTLDTAGQAEDATGSLVGEGNLGVGDEGVTGLAGEPELEIHGNYVGSEIQVGQREGVKMFVGHTGASSEIYMDLEIQVEKREGVEALEGHSGEFEKVHMSELEIQVKKHEGAEVV